MGIYGEVPGERYRSVLDPYRDSAAVIEASDLDYTILRPGWFTQNDEVSYELTQKGEPFKAAVRDAAHARDAELLKAGALMGTTGKPVQVRNPEGSGTKTAQGPFMSSPLPVAGFAIVEAANLDEAIKLVSGCPCAVAWRPVPTEA